MYNDQHFALHTDKYQINMMYAHWKHGSHETMAVFEAYIRKLPFQNGYAVFAGLERMVEYLNRLSFSDKAIAFLAQQDEAYDPAFLEELRKFRFTGQLYAVPEGSVIFANEPIFRIEARVFEAHLIETALLNFMNYQTLVATKASRIKNVAGDDILMEFGSRRAHEADAAIWGTRAAYIAGFHATSNVLASMNFGIPAVGTHAHAWVQLHQNEEEAFMKYAEALPHHVTLLVDTYDTLKSGIPNAIKIGKLLEQQGKRLNAIRLDSGDLAYLSKQARYMLDQAGLQEVKIVASSDIDESTILHLKTQGAVIDLWGVGTKLITCEGQPSLGGVYKIVAKEEDGRYEPTIKISSNPEKITTPGIKKMYRIISRGTGKAIGDYITLEAEDDVEEKRRLKLISQVHPFIYKYVDEYDVIELLRPIMKDGKLTEALPSVQEVRTYHLQQLELFWPEYLRVLNPEPYRVHYSERLMDLKSKMVEEMTNP